MNADPSKNLLKIRKLPLINWTIGVVMILLLAGGVILIPGLNQFQIVLLAAIPALLMILLSPVTTFNADKARGILTITTRRIFLFDSVKEIPLNEIEDIQLHRRVTSDASGEGQNTSYRIVILLKSGKVLPVDSWYIFGHRGKTQVVRRIADFLGLAGAVEIKLTSKNMVQVAMQAQANRSKGQEEWAHVTRLETDPMKQIDQKGFTTGVAWGIETHQIGPQKVTRWICTDFTWPGQFLLIIQKPQGSPSMTGGIMANMMKMILQQTIAVYGFLPEDLPGFENAIELPPNSQLDPNYSCLSSASGSTTTVMNGWVIGALQHWAQCYPMKSMGKAGQSGQLAL